MIAAAAFAFPAGPSSSLSDEEEDETEDESLPLDASVGQGGCWAALTGLVCGFEFNFEVLASVLSSSSELLSSDDDDVLEGGPLLAAGFTVTATFIFPFGLSSPLLSLLELSDEDEDEGDGARRFRAVTCE